MKKVTISSTTTGDEVFSGQGKEFNAAGGNGEYTWTVAGPVAVEGGTGDSYTFTAPTTGAFAGVYTITVADGLGFADFFNVKVPMMLEPEYRVMLADPDAAAVTQTFALMGAPEGTPVTLTQLRYPENDAIPEGEDYGLFDHLTTNFNADSVAAFTYTAPTEVDQKTAFIMSFIVEDDTLRSLGLHEAESDPCWLIPVKEYAGFVESRTGGIPIEGATVAVIGPARYQDYTATTNSEGYFGIILPVTGGRYQFQAIAVDYVPKDFSSDGFDLEDPTRNLVPLTAIAEGAYITGTVWADGQALTVTADVSAIYEDPNTGELNSKTVKSDVNGRFYIGFAADPGATEYTLVASTPWAYTETVMADTLPLTATLDMAYTTTVAAIGGRSVELGKIEQVPVVIEFPVGSIDTDLSSFDALYSTVEKLEHDFVEASGGDVLVKIELPAGVEIAAGQRIKVTIPVDLAELSPGDLEKGTYVIRHAPTRDELLEGGTVVKPSDIYSVDYVGDGKFGSATFFVDSLSVFGVGGPPPPEEKKEEVVYEHDDDFCFIATAAYGSPLEPHVNILRQFRDVYLLPTNLGHAFVDAYYSYSPALAVFIANRDTLRAAVRIGLMPVVGMSYVALHTTAAQKVALIALMLGLMAAAYMAIRRIRVSRQ